MCFDISSTKIKQLFEKNRNATFIKEFDYQPFYHASGFNYPILSIIKAGEKDLIMPANWGFTPKWDYEDITTFRKKYNTLNAKSETLLTSEMYNESALIRRCVILADGFFEPHKSYGETIPYFCYIPSNDFEDGRDIFAFAGIYNEINGNSSCTIITTEANDFFSEIHNLKKRMPLVLAESKIGAWLNNGIDENEITTILKEGFTRKEFMAHSISKSLYNRKSNHNIPNILEKVNYNTLFD